MTLEQGYDGNTSWYVEVKFFPRKSKKKKIESNTALTGTHLHKTVWSPGSFAQRRLRTALFHLQFRENLSLSYDGTLQKECCHHSKLIIHYEEYGILCASKPTVKMQK